MNDPEYLDGVASNDAMDGYYWHEDAEEASDDGVVDLEIGQPSRHVRQQENLAMRRRLLSITDFFSSVLSTSFIIFKLINMISLPVNIRQRTKEKFEGLPLQIQKLYRQPNPAQPILVFSKEDFKAAGIPEDQILNLPYSRFMEFTPVVLCATKKTGPHSVQSVVGGGGGNISRCQRGAPVFHCSGVFVLVSFDPDAEGGKQWHEIETNPGRLPYLKHLAEYRNGYRQELYAVDNATSEVLGVYTRINGSEGSGSYATDFGVGGGNPLTVPMLLAAVDDGILRYPISATEYAIRVFPLIGGEEAVREKEREIIQGARARITELTQQSWNYTRKESNGDRKRKGRFVIRRADGTIHAKSIDLSGAKKVGGQKWRGSNGKSKTVLPFNAADVKASGLRTNKGFIIEPYDIDRCDGIEYDNLNVPEYNMHGLVNNA